MDKKWGVTFEFDRCTPTVIVMAPTPEKAEELARKQQWPHVPQDIKSTVERLGRGGARPGAGAKKGSSTVKVRRTVKKTICWTDPEWEEVVARAKKHGLDVEKYQRMKLLTD